MPLIAIIDWAASPLENVVNGKETSLSLVPGLEGMSI